MRIKKGSEMQQMPDPKLSIIVPTYNEPSHLWFTMCSIKEQLSKFTDMAEIFISNNFPERHKSFDSYEKQGIKICTVVGKSTSTVRNVPAALAKGEILCFCDNHILLGDNVFNRAIEVLDADKHIGILHGKTLLYGDNDGFIRYILTLHKNFGGSNVSNTGDDSVTLSWIPASGHGFYFIRRELFEKIGGYLETQRSWGGEEIFIELAAWMHDYNVTLDRKLYHYHLPMEFVRPNARNAQEFIVSNLASAYVLGGDEWLQKIAPFYLSMGYGPIAPRLARVPEENQVRRERMLQTAKFTVDEVLKFWDDIGLEYKENVADS